MASHTARSDKYQDPLFSLRAAIVRQIEREDWARWAAQAQLVECPNDPLPQFELTPASAYAFGRQIVKRAFSIMLP